MTSGKENILSMLVDFLDNHMLPVSNEKRSVAIYLMTTALKLCPSSYLSICLSAALIRCLIQSRRHKDNILYSLAGHSLRQIIASLSDSTLADDTSACRLILASKFSLYGGLQFDSLVHIPVLKELLSQMDAASIHQHLHFLCSILFTTSTADDKIDNSEEDGATETRGGLALGIIESFYILAKNKALIEHDYIYKLTICLFFSITLLSSAEFDLIATTGSKGKVTGDMSSISKIMQDMLQHVNFAAWYESYDENMKAKLREEVARRLKALLADDLNSTSSSPAISFLEHMTSVISSKKHNKKKKASSPELEVLFMFSVSDDVDTMTQTIQSFCSFLHKHQASSSSSSTGTTISLLDKMKRSFVHFFEQAIIHVFLSHDKYSDLEVLSDLMGILSHLLELGSSMKEDEEDSLAKLGAICVDLLDTSSSTDQTIKGMKESMKSLWHSLGLYFASLSSSSSNKPVIYYSSTMLMSLVEVITDSSSQNMDDEDSEEEDESSDEDDEEAVNKPQAMEEDEEEEIMLSSKDMFQLFAPDDDSEDEEEAVHMIKEKEEDEDDEEDGPGLHSEAMDFALSELIQLKQSTRKASTNQRKRQKYIHRIRVLELLETILSSPLIFTSTKPSASSADTAAAREEEKDLACVLTMISQLYQCWKATITSKLYAKISEIKSFHEKLTNLFIERIFSMKKKSFFLAIGQLSAAGQEMIGSSLTELIEVFQKPCQVQEKSVKAVIMGIYVFLMKTCYLADSGSFIGTSSIPPGHENTSAIEDVVHKPIKEQVMTISQEIFTAFLQKKATRCLYSNFFEELSQKYPNYMILLLQPMMIDGILTAKSSYLRSESFKYLLECYKRFKGLELAVQVEILQALAKLIDSLAKYVKENMTSMDRLDQEKKKKAAYKSLGNQVKEMLICVKNILASAVINHADRLQQLSYDQRIMIKQGLADIKDLLDKMSDQHDYMKNAMQHVAPIIEDIAASNFLEVKMKPERQPSAGEKKDEGSTSSKKKKRSVEVDYEQEYVGKVLAKASNEKAKQDQPEKKKAKKAK
jgi:hypothetical protein